MPLNIDKLRAETDGCQGSLAHFNNAGASLMPSCVLKATRDHLDLENMIGGYEAAARMQPAMDQVYQNVARLINADTDEIALLNNATEGWNSAFYSLGWETGDQVITTRSEYNSNMIAFRHLEDRAGIEIVLTPDSEDGTLDLEALDRLIGARTKLVAVSHMPTNEGLVQPVEQVGKIVQAHNVPFLLDACQSVGQMPIDVRKIGCTMLSATGRKYLRGPRGTGFLWMRRDWIVRTTPHVLDSRSAYWDRVDGFTIAPDARRFELWEKNVAGLLGLGAACRYAHDTGLEQVWTRIRKSSAALRNGLKAIPGITVQDRGGLKSGIVTFCHDTIGASEFVDRLREDCRINTSVSDTQLTRQILTRQGVLELVRASLHAFNSDAEISSLIEAVEVIRRGRTQGRRAGIAAAVPGQQFTHSNRGG